MTDIDPLNCEYLITHLLSSTLVYINFFGFPGFTCSQNA